MAQKLRHQSSVKVEVIVLDSESRDGTPKLARDAGASLHTISRTTFGHGSVRNYAATYANGEILVFMTQDVTPLDNQFLINLVRPLSKDERQQASQDKLRPHQQIHSKRLLANAITPT